MASGDYSTIGGGVNNLGSAVFVTVSGGSNNTASARGATVGGGQLNTASDWYSTVGGGSRNTASGWSATVGGGAQNTASAGDSAVGGGIFNTASGSASTIGGGMTNIANGEFATIPGGRGNAATNYAFAAGHRAKANHRGAFVWADATDADFPSTGTNQFLVRANGGVGINTNHPGWSGGAMLAVATPSTNIPAIRLIGPETEYGWGARLAFGDTNRVYLMEDADDKLLIYTDGRTAIMGGNVGINTLSPSYRLHVEGTAGKTGGGTWSDSSDARLKTDVQEISGALARLTQLRGVTFEWIHPDQHGRAPGEREAGLIAQEVEAVFPEWVTEVPAHGADAALLGDHADMKTLAFPHGFNAYVIEAFKEVQAENEALKAKNEGLEVRLQRLETLMEALLE